MFVIAPGGPSPPDPHGAARPDPAWPTRSLRAPPFAGKWVRPWALARPRLVRSWLAVGEGSASGAGAPWRRRLAGLRLRALARTGLAGASGSGRVLSGKCCYNDTKHSENP